MAAAAVAVAGVQEEGVRSNVTWKLQIEMEREPRAVFERGVLCVCVEQQHKQAEGECNKNGICLASFSNYDIVHIRGSALSYMIWNYPMYKKLCGSTVVDSN